jgi:hypothetical protein
MFALRVELLLDVEEAGNPISWPCPLYYVGVWVLEVENLGNFDRLDAH